MRERSHLRRPGKAPTEYPVACSPQAWSAGAVFMLLEAAIGLSIDAVEKRILLDRPVLPDFLEHLTIRGLTLYNDSVDLVVFRSRDAVAVTVERRTGDVEVAGSKLVAPGERYYETKHRQR